MKKWSRWYPFPDPKAGGYLNAPFGPGVYELRHRVNGNLILYGMSKNVSARMSSLLPNPLGTGNRDNDEKREFVTKHLNNIDYRTLACVDTDTAAVEERKLRANKHAYIFFT